jgi:hypothetical protein
MKTSIKIAVLLAAITGASFTAKAQNSTTASNGIIYSAGVESGLSVGKFKDTQNWNLGGSIQADIPVISQLYVTINSGFQNYFGKNNVYSTSFSAKDIQVIPVKAGLKFFPIGKLYVQGEAGADFVLNKADAGYDKTAAFVYAPQVGYQFALNGNSLVDIGARYEASTRYTDGLASSKINTIGLRVAYR